MNGTPRMEMRSSAHELFMSLLTLLSTVNLVLVVAPFMSGAGRQVVFAVELILSPIFLGDFLLRLATTRSRRGYLLHGWGWTDLLAAVPFLAVVPAPPRGLQWSAPCARAARARSSRSSTWPGRRPPST